MKLPDFLNFDPFNELRRRMGAEALGEFVFFDPKRHLTGLELLELNKAGLDADAGELRILDDFTLAYKNARVLVYRTDGEAHREDEGRVMFHLANCPHVNQWQSVERPVAVKVASCAPESTQVCESCLQRLHYQGFDGVRQRHRDYSQRIYQDFDVAGFFEQYPSYPIEQAAAPVF
jgi:hypothetical protein